MTVGKVLKSSFTNSLTLLPSGNGCQLSARCK